MKSRLYCILAVFVVWPLSMKAQLTDTATYQYRISAAGNLALGNVQRFIFNGEAMFARVHKTWGLSTRNLFFYFDNRKMRLDNDLASRNFFYRYPKKRLYPFLMVWYEKNFRRKIDYRYQLGVGGSYALVLKPAATAKVSLTFTREETAFFNNNFKDNAAINNRKDAIFRYTARLTGTKLFTESKLKIGYEAWGQFGIAGKAYPRIYSELNIDFPIVKKLNFRTSAIYGYEERIHNLTKQNDFLLLFGLSFNSK
jgi:Protein of unknown function, DUF481